eukprot:1160393-Pelagomonas_calceolata.AAC.4
MRSTQSEQAHKEEAVGTERRFLCTHTRSEQAMAHHAAAASDGVKQAAVLLPTAAAQLPPR